VDQITARAVIRQLHIACVWTTTHAHVLFQWFQIYWVFNSYWKGDLGRDIKSLPTTGVRWQLQIVFKLSTV